MEIARIAIQCVDPRSGQTGDWLFINDNHKLPENAVSPLFYSLIDLFAWCRQNGWEGQEDGTYVKRDSN